MTAAKHHTSFASAISLEKRWPSFEPKELSIAAHIRFAASYVEAAERIFFHEGDVRHKTEFYLGPVVQLTGLAAELTLKTLLRGSGCDERRIKSFGHSTYKAYYDARKLFDEPRFIMTVADNCEAYMPLQTRKRLDDYFGSSWPDGWNIFIPQIRLLDQMYDRPFRSRYHTSGQIYIPETFVIIVGLKTILAAMLERIGDHPLPGSLINPPTHE